MNKQYFNARNTHAFMGLFGLFLILIGTQTIYDILNNSPVKNSPVLGIALIVFGGVLLGAALQSFFRVRNEYRGKKRKTN